MALIKGELEEAQLENLASDPSNLPDGRAWYDTATNRVKTSIAGVATNLVTPDSTDAFTNKNIDAEATGNSISNIKNANIKAGAAIARDKLASGSNYRVVTNDASGVMTDAAAITASRALVSDTNGIPTHSATTATELGYVAGVTSAIQTQLDSKVAKSTLTTKGDIYVATGAGVVVRKAVGANGTVLSADSAQSDGLTWTTPLTNPMTTAGDIIVGGGAGVPARLAAGSSGQYLRISSGTPAWVTPTLPTVQRFTSGSGTYTTPANVKYIRVKAIGGGGGGATGANSGSSGGASTFGTTMISAGGGSGAVAAGGLGGAGGTVSSASVSYTITAVSGNAGQTAATTASSAQGGNGGPGIFGGNGIGGAPGNSNATSAAANSGGGGGGAGGATGGATAGGGGGAGGYVEAIINSPSASYSYAVGSGGAAATGGTYTAGAGGSGIIIVEEYY